jgi:hypothetical protein
MPHAASPRALDETMRHALAQGTVGAMFSARVLAR